MEKAHSQRRPRIGKSWEEEEEVKRKISEENIIEKIENRQNVI